MVKKTMKLREAGDLVKQTVKNWSEDKAGRLAAALSYYTIFSLAPLLVIAIAVAGLIFTRGQAQAQVIGQIQELTGSEEIAGLVGGMIESVSQPGASIVALMFGGVTLLFGAAGVFGQLQDALNTIWGVTPVAQRGLGGVIKNRFLSFLMVFLIGFLLLASLLITAALSILDNFLVDLLPAFELVSQLINFFVSFGIITLLFGLIFKILPEADLAWRDVWLGAAVTALLFTLGRMALGIYLGSNAVASPYGAAGSLVLILLWIYYSAQIFFLGAEFTQVYANRYGSRASTEAAAIQQKDRERSGRGRPVQETPAVAPYAPGAGATGRAPGAHPELLPEAKPALRALSTVLAVFVGFIGGMIVTRSTSSKNT